MNRHTRFGVALLLAACLLAIGRGSASAATSTLTLQPDQGPASSVLQFTYTLRLDGNDPPCPPAPVELIWDEQIMLGSVPFDCGARHITGAMTPTGEANGEGFHSLCAGNPDRGLPLACANYKITPEPAATPCGPRGPASPPCAPTPANTFEPDCIPTGQPRSPLCVTVTPIPYCDDGSHTLNSPPCADAMTSTPTIEATTPPEPTITPVTPPDPCAVPGTPTPPCTTPSPTATATPTKTATARAIGTCAATVPKTPVACTSPTTTNRSDDGGGVHVKWGAVAIAAVAITALGAASAGGWWWWRQ